MPGSCWQTLPGTASLSLSMAPYQPADAAAKPLPRARTTGPDDGEGKRFRQSRRAPAVDAGDAPQARIVRCCSTTEPEPPDGTQGNGLTTGVSQQEPYHEKGNDSGKSAANRRNPALLRSHRQRLLGGCEPRPTIFGMSIIWLCRVCRPENCIPGHFHRICLSDEIGLPKRIFARGSHPVLPHL